MPHHLVKGFPPLAVHDPTIQVHFLNNLAEPFRPFGVACSSAYLLLVARLYLWCTVWILNIEHWLSCLDVRCIEIAFLILNARLIDAEGDVWENLLCNFPAVLHAHDHVVLRCFGG